MNQHIKTPEQDARRVMRFPHTTKRPNRRRDPALEGLLRPPAPLPWRVRAELWIARQRGRLGDWIAGRRDDR